MKNAGMEILLVEDNMFDAELTVWTLKKYQIENIVHVDTYAGALEYLSGSGKFANRNPHHQPCVILLDLKIGAVSGVKLLEKLKADTGTKDIPVIVLSGSPQDEDIERCLSLGAVSYMVKPVEFSSFTKDVLKPLLLRKEC